MTQQAYIQSQSGELVPIGVVDTGFSLGPYDNDGVLHTGTNYEAQMKFEAQFTITHEEMWENLCRTFKLGRWAYTPEEELRDRLNTRLRGKQPAAAINTRYWRNL